MSEVPLYTHFRKVHAFDQESAFQEGSGAVYSGIMFDPPQIAGPYSESLLGVSKDTLHFRIPLNMRLGRGVLASILASKKSVGLHPTRSPAQAPECPPLALAVAACPSSHCGIQES